MIIARIIPVVSLSHNLSRTAGFRGGTQHEQALDVIID
jgi:hypothetical protein